MTVVGKSQVLGLDIGRYSVKAALATSRGNRVEFTRTETLRLPTGNFDRKAILSRWIKEQNLGGYPCVIALSGQQAMFQPMFLEAGDPRSMEQAASMEMLKMRDIAAENMAYGLASFGESHGERRILLAMARPAVLQDAMGLLQSLDLELLDLLPAPVALFNALAASPVSGPTVFAHIGSSATEIAVGNAEGLMFARAFAVGGQPFTEALAKVKQMAVPHAETLKTTGPCSLDDGDPAVTAALTRVADLWVSEFQSCLAVFNSLFSKPADRPVQLVLSGGGALLTGFADYIGKKTGLKCTLVTQLPVEGACPAPPVWAIAAGLCYSALKPRKCAISFLPQAVRDEQTFRREKPFWLAAGIVAALILLVSLAGGYYDYKRMAEHLNMQRASLERRRQLVARIEEMQKKGDLIRSMAVPVSTLLRVGPTVRDLLSLVAASKHSSDVITLFCDAESYQYKSPSAALLTRPGMESVERRRRMMATVTEIATNKPMGFEHVIIEGATRKLSFSTVQTLIDRLESAQSIVASADLLSDDKLVKADPLDSQNADRRVKRFVIDVKVKTP
jgi:Tfp pilus assembly PilM family ATPase